MLNGLFCEMKSAAMRKWWVWSALLDGREGGGLVEVEVVVVVRSINSCISRGFLLGWFAF